MDELMKHLPEVQAELELICRAGRYREYAQKPETPQEKRLIEWLMHLPTT